MRVKVTGQDEFNPREWLRREVLWASLMSPYPEQLEGWMDGRAAAQHAGNTSRQSIYDIEGDGEAKALAFFNQGKNIAGIVSSAVLFEVLSLNLADRSPAELAEIQAKNIDRTLGRVAMGEVIKIPEVRAYEVCSRLAHLAVKSGIDKQDNLMHARQIMIELAAAEANDWLNTARQNEEGSLPIIEIPDGGYPRSAGNRVDSLQPILHEIVSSPEYEALRIG